MPPTIARSALLALTLLACAGPAAQAAESIAIQVGADPTEEVPLPMTVSWISANPAPAAYVTVKPAGSLGCGPNYAADAPNSDDVILDSGVAVDSVSRNQTFYEPGTFVLCGYLQYGSTVLATTGPIALTVRSTTASLGIAVPARVDPGQVFPMSVAVTTEVSRSVHVTVKPAGGRGCEPNYAADYSVSDDLLTTSVQGAHTVTRNVAASTTKGTYLLCGYVQERSADAPEAIASAQFVVAPDPCTAATRAERRARRSVRRAQAAVRRNHRAWERKLAAALRSSGATRRAYRALAAQARRRERRAIRRRTAARAVLAERRTAVAQACGAPPG